MLQENVHAPSTMLGRTITSCTKAIVTSPRCLHKHSCKTASNLILWTNYTFSFFPCAEQTKRRRTFSHNFLLKNVKHHTCIKYNHVKHTCCNDRQFCTQPKLPMGVITYMQTQYMRNYTFCLQLCLEKWCAMNVPVAESRVCCGSQLYIFVRITDCIPVEVKFENNGYSHPTWNWSASSVKRKEVTMYVVNRLEKSETTYLI